MDKKKALIGILCTLIMIMAVGYALLAQQLKVIGSASIISNWQVEITNIIEKEKSIGATTNSTNYTATTASFSTKLTSPGDYAIYEVTVTNKGTLDAVLAAKPIINVSNNSAIVYGVNGIKKGDKLLKNTSSTFTVKVAYNSSTTTQPVNVTSNLEVVLNYEQDLGQVIVYNTYAKGDKVNFSNSEWYVIEDSDLDVDYVTLLKAIEIDGATLGDYANYTNNSQMHAQWTDDCHWSGVYGYTSTELSGCGTWGWGYSGSKVEEFLNQKYLSLLGSSNLKEVNGYKIRLMTKENFEELGCNCYIENNSWACDCRMENSSNPFKWVYSGARSYWTMIETGNAMKWVVTTSGEPNYGRLRPGYLYSGFAVRPVINLLKSAIE